MRLETELPCDVAVPPGHTDAGDEISMSKICPPSMVTVALNVHTSRDMEGTEVSMDKAHVVDIARGILLGHTKERSPALCDSLDGPRRHSAKCTKSGRERQILSMESTTRNSQEQSGMVVARGGGIGDGKVVVKGYEPLGIK